MDFVILGPTALHVDGASIPLGAAKQRGMLALLLYHAGEPVRVDTIVEHLWNGRHQPVHRANLYSLVSRARAALGRADLGEALHRVPSTGAYRLDIDPQLVDYHRFRRLVTHGRDAAQEHRYAAAVEALAEATRLWHDEPLADLHAARADELRRHMNHALLDAWKLLATNRLRLGEHHRALAELEPLVRDNELDETLAQLWVSALCGAGLEPEAHAFLLTFRRQFRRHVRAEPAVELPGPRAAGGTGPAPVQQLPKDIGDFVGHEQLLAALDSPGAGTSNVVAISGMPGVGKTTLAVHWAHRRRHRFPDGMLHLDARAYGPGAAVDPEEALGRFLHALDVPPDRMPAGLDQRRSRYNQLLADRRMLILLDNVRDAAQVRPLIPTADGCVTLITSRTRLRGLTVRDGVPGLTVPPLPEADGLALLGRTVGDERSRAEPDAAGALARLCAGLPLALRIVGEHVAERPRASLGDLVVELTGRLLDADCDEASLRTVFAWSYDTLSPDAARLFRRLALQPGPTIGPEAAAALLGTAAADAEPLLDGLARMCLINHDTARRYRVHDLLRQFAADRAAEDDPPAVRAAALRRLLDWSVLSGANALAVLVPERGPVPDLPEPGGVVALTFATDRDAMAWCEAERENLGAAALWAARNGFDRHAWQLPQVLLETLQRRGHLEEALPLLRSARVAAERDGHDVARVGTLNNLGAVYFALHDHANAVASFDEALRLARGIGDPGAETMCLHNLAAVHLGAGDAAVAASIHRSVLAACRAAANPTGEASARHQLGDALRRMGRPDEAAAHYLEALHIRERMGSLRGQGALQRALAETYLEGGRPGRALGHGERALDLHGRATDDPGRCDALTTVADIRLALGAHDDAVRDAERAVALSVALADTRRRCRALAALADALAARGEHAPAGRRSAEALTLLDEVNDPQLRPVRDRLRRLAPAGTPSA